MKKIILTVLTSALLSATLNATSLDKNRLERGSNKSVRVLKSHKYHRNDLTFNRTFRDSHRYD